jgi:lipopolysaccharide biosynthesis glycosyltransferase
MLHYKARWRIQHTKWLTKLRNTYIRATKLELNENQIVLPDRYCTHAYEYKKYLKSIKNQKIAPDFIKKYEQHLINTIFKKIPKEDRLNYKVKFWIKFLKEEEWTWYTIEKYFNNYPNSTTNSVWEALSESIDIILKIISDF